MIPQLVRVENYSLHSSAALHHHQRGIVLDPRDKGSSISTPVLDSSRLASTASMGFLALPDWIRNQIYQTVLIILQPLYLFQDPGSPVATFAPDKPLHWLALLYTNRQISAEASAVLYSVNHFEFVDITMGQIGVVRSFLDCIGSVNAATLSHLCISFPSVISIDEEPGNVRLRDDSLQSLKLLQDKCTKLSTLETVVHYKNSDLFTRPDQFLREAFTQINTHLKAIQSLQRIIVRIESQTRVPGSAKDVMQQLGWLVLPRNGN